MARADLLVRLVRSASRGDQPLFRKTVEALVAEERAKQHHILAERLEESLKRNGAGWLPEQRLASPRADQVLELHPDRRLDELILPATVSQALEEVIEEQHRAELLRSHNLEPRHRLLFAGPPGNGKTSLAEALATELVVPLCFCAGARRSPPPGAPSTSSPRPDRRRRSWAYSSPGRRRTTSAAPAAKSKPRSKWSRHERLVQCSLPIDALVTSRVRACYDHRRDETGSPGLRQPRGRPAGGYAVLRIPHPSGAGGRAPGPDRSVPEGDG